MTPTLAQVAQLHLDGEMTIYRAAELRGLLLNALAGEGPLELDLADVTEMDTSGVQLLLAARKFAAAAGRDLTLAAISPEAADVLATQKSLQASGRRLRLAGSSTAVQEVLATLGLAAQLEDAPSEPAH